MNPSFGRKPKTQLWASSNSAAALLRAPTQTQENNYIWTLDSLISASAQAYTSSMTKTSEWSLMPAKPKRPKGLSQWAQCWRQCVVLQLRPTKAERSPSPVKEVPTSPERTSWDCRQALTCCLSNQIQTRAQRASPSMGPSKPDKEAPGLQSTGKGGKSNPLTQTDNHMLYTTQTQVLLI